MPDDFQPEHAYHLVERCPATLPFMALPPGWRFVISDSGDAAEFDASLLE